MVKGPCAIGLILAAVRLRLSSILLVMPKLLNRIRRRCALELSR